MDFEVGYKIAITTADGAFEGIVEIIDEENEKFLLGEVVNSKNGKHLRGLLCFFAKEIRHLEILRENGERKQNTFLQKYVASDPEMESQVASSFVNGSNDNQKNRNASSSNRKLPNGCSKSKPDVVIIDSLDNSFYRAIKYISHEREVGLSVEGMNVGRHGRLCWLQIATLDYIFMFDMLDLAEEFLREGLSSILKDNSITKIIHDCRRISDALYHKYKLKLVNVYDTQVADVLVYKLLNGGEMPRYVRNISVCLTDHLKFSTSDVYFPHEDEACWKRRPLEPSMIDAAVKNVAYLQKLKYILIEKLNSELRCGIDLYLSSIRDSRDEEVAMTSPHLLPTSFQKLLTNSLKKKAGNGLLMQNNEVYFDCYGFKTNRVPITNPKFIYTRDSWHDSEKENSQFLKMSKNKCEKVVEKPSEIPQKKKLPEEETLIKSPVKDTNPIAETNIVVEELCAEEEVNIGSCNIGSCTETFTEDIVHPELPIISSDIKIGSNIMKPEPPKLNIIPAGIQERQISLKYLKSNSKNKQSDNGNTSTYHPNKGRGVIHPNIFKQNWYS